MQKNKYIFDVNGISLFLLNLALRIISLIKGIVDKTIIDNGGKHLIITNIIILIYASIINA